MPKMAAAALSLSGAVTSPSPERPGPGPGLGRAPEEELPVLDPAEVRSRLERSARQFRNRRKVLIRGLPPDVSNQVPGTGAPGVKLSPGTGDNGQHRAGAAGPGLG